LSISASWAKVRLGYLYVRRGEEQFARRFFREALFSFQKADSKIGFLFTLEGLASLAASQNNYEKAAQLFAWAEATLEKINDHRPPVVQTSVERDLEVIHSHLNDSEFARLWTEGQSLRMEEAVALALEKIHE
jgi:hypothetical protein